MKISLYPFRPVMCTPSDLIQAEIYQETYVTANVYNVLTIVCYVAMWVLIILRKENNPNIKRLCNSLTAIIVVNFVGTLNTQIWFLVMPKLSFSAVDIDSFITVPTLLMYVAASGSNMPLLYIFSLDYKKAFKKSFKTFILWHTNNNKYNVNIKSFANKQN
uniref:Uncharacterized protein n=1 Tax=Meloidogyne enterolobii TaxID=390850 RepID=A0A6V7TWU5_MELEN|nr:unnamed protein product [Meloidogyne enterolobii]